MTSKFADYLKQKKRDREALRKARLKSLSEARKARASAILVEVRRKARAKVRKRKPRNTFAARAKAGKFHPSAMY